MESKRFNTRLHNAKNKWKASNNYLKRVAVFSRTLVQEPLTKIKKKKFAIDMARKFGTLTAKNALMYLELFYPHRRPLALKGIGMLWGPGATGWGDSSKTLVYETVAVCFGTRDSEDD